MLPRIRQTNSAKNLYCANGTDGWKERRKDGWTGDQKYPLVSLKFKYVNKYDVLIPNKAFKVVRRFFIKSYGHFKFQIRKYKVDCLCGKRLKNLITTPNAISRCAPADRFLPSGSSKSLTHHQAPNVRVVWMGRIDERKEGRMYRREIKSVL